MQMMIIPRFVASVKSKFSPNNATPRNGLVISTLPKNLFSRCIPDLGCLIWAHRHNVKNGLGLLGFGRHPIKEEDVGKARRLHHLLPRFHPVSRYESKVCDPAPQGAVHGVPRLPHGESLPRTSWASMTFAALLFLFFVSCCSRRLTISGMSSGRPMVIIIKKNPKWVEECLLIARTSCRVRDVSPV